MEFETPAAASGDIEKSPEAKHDNNSDNTDVRIDIGGDQPPPPPPSVTTDQSTYRRELSALDRIELIYQELLEISPYPRKSTMKILHMLPCQESFYNRGGALTDTKNVKWMSNTHHYVPIIVHNYMLGKLGTQFTMHSANIKGMNVVGCYEEGVDAVVDLIWGIFLKFPDKFTVYNEDGTVCEDPAGANAAEAAAATKNGINDNSDNTRTDAFIMQKPSQMINGKTMTSVASTTKKTTYGYSPQYGTSYGSGSGGGGGSTAKTTTTTTAAATTATTTTKDVKTQKKESKSD